MTAKEVESFEKKHGYKPTAIGVAIDALAVYVNKDNPIRGLSLEEVDAVMSVGRKCGGAADLTKWGQLGLTGDWASRDIAMYGRNSVSGTYGYFKEKALCKGDFKRNVAEQPGSASVVQSVSTQLAAIGYSGIGYKTSGVRALPLSKTLEQLTTFLADAIKILWLCSHEPADWRGLRGDLPAFLEAVEAWGDRNVPRSKQVEAVNLALQIFNEAGINQAVAEPTDRADSGN